MKTRRNISLDDEAEAALDHQTAAGGNVSAYLAGLIAAAELDRALALATVREAGWRPAELSAACAALNGSSGFGLAIRPGALASNLSLAGMSAVQRKAWLDHYNVDVDTWNQRCGAVAKDDELAAAIAVVARLFWADDAIVGRAVNG